MAGLVALVGVAARTSGEPAARENYLSNFLRVSQPLTLSALTAEFVMPVAPAVLASGP